MAQLVKNLPAVRETWVQSLGREDLLEKEMAPHSSILAWKIPWKEEPTELRALVADEPEDLDTEDEGLIQDEAGLARKFETTLASFLPKKSQG